MRSKANHSQIRNTQRSILLFILSCCATFSFSQNDIKDSSKLCQEILDMRKKDSLYRSQFPSGFNRNSNLAKKEEDSLRTLQRTLDNKSTERLLELTETYGWLSDERLNCGQLDAWLIFRHSQSQYYEAISKIIEKEFKAGRLNKFQYMMIKDHITGRPKG